VEGDDTNAPIADAARGILDGHIVLSRQLAESGHYPAIDVEASISRVMADIVPASQLQAARRLRNQYSLYQSNRDLITLGAYQAGSDPRIDQAIAIQPKISDFLQQDMHQAVSLEESTRKLVELINEA